MTMPIVTANIMPTKSPNAPSYGLHGRIGSSFRSLSHFFINLNYTPFTCCDGIVAKKDFKLFIKTPDIMALQHEYSDILQEIQVLTKRRQTIKRLLKSKGHQPMLHRAAYFEKPIFLYALLLEGDHYYVGTSRNVERRFARHSKGKGAQWTKLHKPVEILETRPTKSNDENAAALLEDDMTLEYALKFGSDKVRGGGYCQTKPRWPDVVVQNEKFY